MINLSKQDIEQIAAYAWVLTLASTGGAVAFFRKVRLGHARAFNVAEFIGEVATAGFAGIITFYLCEWSNFNPMLTKALVGIAGHMGSRALFQLEFFFNSKFPKIDESKLP